MPSLFFDTQEIEATGTAKVNKKTGLVYIGRKYDEVIWIKLKECKKKPT